MMTRIFVYGTLLRGEPNHARLAGDLFVRTAETKGKMYSVGYFPGVRFDQAGEVPIKGEVYDVTPESLQALDWLEGYYADKPERSHYRRIEVELADGERVQTYQYNRGVETLPVVTNGSWRNPQPKKIKLGR